ncbi:DUF4998 domain-containing protein [Niabella hirudinis]|uniref:DUF4998 domain-containing protein n=1 Tax=Niabella hirudinis TaxID=1285929 RepID=UPI003EBCB51E
MNFKIITLLAILFCLTACEKEGYNYDKYLNGREITYTGTVSNLKANPGNQRVQLTWNPSSDPTIVKYVIRYNSQRDSIVVNANGETTAQTVKAYIPGLGEYVQEFTLYTYDAAGNKSIGQTITAVRVYGPIYSSTLRNRPSSGAGFDNSGNVLINFTAALDTVNTTTRLTYKNTAGAITNVLLHPDSLKVALPGWKDGENVLIQSAYVPVRNSVDTFWVSYSDTLKGKDIFYSARVAGSFTCTGTLERQPNPVEAVNENKDISYQGNNIFKTILPVFNNSGLTLYLRVNDDNSVTIMPNSGSEASVAITADGPCSFDPVAKKFLVNFTYTNTSNLFRRGSIVYTRNL